MFYVITFVVDQAHAFPWKHDHDKGLEEDVLSNFEEDEAVKDNCFSVESDFLVESD